MFIVVKTGRGDYPVLSFTIASQISSVSVHLRDEDADDSLDNLYTKHCADDLAANRTSLLQLCRLSQYEINSLVRGARTGIAICQLQYKSERWNCSSNDWNAFLSKSKRVMLLLR